MTTMDVIAATDITHTTTATLNTTGTNLMRVIIGSRIKIAIGLSIATMHVTDVNRSDVGTPASIGRKSSDARLSANIVARSSNNTSTGANIVMTVTGTPGPIAPRVTLRHAGSCEPIFGWVIGCPTPIANRAT